MKGIFYYNSDIDKSDRHLPGDSHLWKITLGRSHLNGNFMKIFSLTSRRKHKSDRELLNDYRIHDDLSALGELFQKYSHLAFCVCQKYLKNTEESKDAVMEIFEGSITKLKKYEVSNFKSWLYATIRNYCNYRLRRAAIEDIFDKNIE